MVGASPLNQLVAPQMALVERSWHLLTVLLRFGRPASAPELASRCVISSSPDFIECLCGIPGSPLLLTDDGLVTLSTVAMEAFVAFVSNSITPFIPRFRTRVLEQMRPCGNACVMYTRKRKARLLEDAVVVYVPRAKRMLILPNRDLEVPLGDEESTAHLSLVTKEALQKYFMLPDVPNNTLNVGSIVNENPEMALNKNHPLPMEIDWTMEGCVNFSFNKVQPDGVDDVLLDFQSFKGNCSGVAVNASLSEEITPKEILVSKSLVDEPDFMLASRELLMDRPVHLEKKTEMPIEKDSRPIALLPAIPLPVKSDNQTFICQATCPAQDTEATEILYCQPGASVGIGSSKKSLEEHSVAGQTSGRPEPSAACLPVDFQVVNDQQSKTFMKPHSIEQRSLFVGLRDSNSPIDHQTNDSSTRKNKDKMDPKYLVKKKNVNICNNDAVIKEKAIPVPKASKNQLASKSQPNLESFVIEEEEGSGGYGTVYRARRKTDGKVFAVKCPHTNAHSHHVNNEMKMLERFGGSNFVIKYEGSFRSGNSECFVLEHVEHDRPEVLKKEITIFELQWYGYCMFRALASLHKQGIAHRDVKHGNFLFSRRFKKGYLIDFNLASDLNQKFFKDNNGNDGNTKLDSVPLSNMKSTLLKQSRRVTKDEILGNGGKETANDLKKHHPSKGLKKRCESIPQNALGKIDNIKRGGSQTADVSGVTSAKDPTSTKTPIDKLKQPIPYKGRKELINFLHEAMQAPKQKGSTVPAAQRKRVAAPLGKMDRRLVMLTPMPLHFGGSAVAGAGMYYNKRNGKLKREGPCVGTKGFRAPEVLFKSVHQGCKVDIWSAGVTLLYLMIGKTPFGGDPEQNIKDIAKLRGSEDLWEVAKLHNSESCFPQELLDVQFLRSLELREWCLLNTRRPEFIEAIPHSLFDLVDKCLTVNPRCRVSAEEALMHDFFAPCHESLRKQSTLRKETTLELGAPFRAICTDESLHSFPC